MRGAFAAVADRSFDSPEERLGFLVLVFEVLQDGLRKPLNVRHPSNGATVGGWTSLSCL